MKTRVGMNALESARALAPLLLALKTNLFGGAKENPLPTMFEALLKRSLESPEATMSRSDLYDLSTADSTPAKSEKSLERETRNEKETDNKNFTWRLRVLRASVEAIGPLPPDGLFFRWQSFRDGRKRAYRIDFGLRRGSGLKNQPATSDAQRPVFRYRYKKNSGQSSAPLQLDANVIGHCVHRKDFNIRVQKLGVDWGSFLGIGDVEMNEYKKARDRFWEKYAENERNSGHLAWNGRLWGLCRHTSVQRPNSRVLSVELSVTRIRQADVVYCRTKLDDHAEWSGKKTPLALGDWLQKRRLEAREAIPVLSPICLGVLLITAEKHIVITQQGETKHRAQQWSLTGRGALDSVYAPEEESTPDLELLVQRKVAEEVGIPVSSKWIRPLGFAQLEENGHSNNILLVAVSTNHSINRVEEFIEERKFRSFISSHKIIPLKTAETELADKSRFQKVDESLLLALALNRMLAGKAEVVTP